MLRGERGSGVLSAAMGLVFVLGLLLLATSVLLTLYRTSAVAAAATDAAHAAARATAPASVSASVSASTTASVGGVGDRACDESVARTAVDLAHQLLGPDVRASAACGDGAVSVTVEAPRPSLGALVGRGPIRRTAEARFEARR